jgi:pilus assembly protein Flp/PilA
MKNLTIRFLKNRAGATAIEYGLIATFIAVSLIVGAGSLGGSINETMSSTANFLEDNR